MTNLSATVVDSLWRTCSGGRPLPLLPRRSVERRSPKANQSLQPLRGPRAFLARVQPRERQRAAPLARRPLPGPYSPPELPRGGQPLLLTLLRPVPPSVVRLVLAPVPVWRTAALPEAPRVCSLATRTRLSRLDPLNLRFNLRLERYLGSAHREPSGSGCWTGTGEVTPLGSSSTQTLLGSVSTSITLQPKQARLLACLRYAS